MNRIKIIVRDMKTDPATDANFTIRKRRIAEDTTAWAQSVVGATDGWESGPDEVAIALAIEQTMQKAVNRWRRHVADSQVETIADMEEEDQE